MRPFAAQMLAVALLGTGAAAAQTPGEGLALRWRAPTECPSEGEVAAAVTRLLGRPLDHLTPPASGRRADPSRASALEPADHRHDRRDAATPRALGGHLRRGGRRRRTGARAGHRPRRRQRAPHAPRTAPAPPPDPPPAPRRSDARAHLPERAAAVSTPPSAPGRAPRVAPAPIAGFARLGALGDLGAQPSLTWGATLVLGLSFRAFRAELSGTYFGPQSARVRPGDPSQGGEFSLIAGALRGCLAAPLGPVDLGGCAGVELGVQSGAAIGVSAYRRAATRSGSRCPSWPPCGVRSRGASACTSRRARRSPCCAGSSPSRASARSFAPPP